MQTLGKKLYANTLVIAAFYQRLRHFTGTHRFELRKYNAEFAKQITFFRIKIFEMRCMAEFEKCHHLTALGSENSFELYESNGLLILAA